MPLFPFSSPTVNYQNEMGSYYSMGIKFSLLYKINKFWKFAVLPGAYS